MADTHYSPYEHTAFSTKVRAKALDGSVQLNLFGTWRVL